MTKETNAPAAVAAAPRTLQEQIAIAQARLNKLLAKQNTVEILNKVAAGDTATFSYGRAEKARVLSGVIAAVGDVTDERGRVTRQALVKVGEGLDETSYKVRVADIQTLNGEGFSPGSTEDEGEEAADEAEGEASEGDAADPFAEDASDPLAAN